MKKEPIHPAYLNNVLISFLKSKTPIYESDDELRAAAFHEAGHTVFAYKYNAEIQYCYISEKEDFGGGCRN
jgi:hypothetical protein